MNKHRVNILLIANNEQDYINIRQLLSEIDDTSFENWILYLEWVASYESALQMIEHKQHDVYLIDGQFNNGGGVALLQKIVADGCRTPLILLINPQDQLVAVKEGGATDYLNKEQLNAPLLERSIRYAIKSGQMENLQKSHHALMRWARKRTGLLKRVNKRYREEINGHSQAENELKQSEEKYRTLIDNIQDGVLSLQDGRIIFANESMAKMIGYTVDEIIGFKFMDIVDPEDLKILARHDERISDEVQSETEDNSLVSQVKEYEFNLLHKNTLPGTNKNSRVMVNITLGPITYQGKVATIATVKDITTRKQIEQQLRKLSQVVHQSPISILITDTQGNIEYVNPEFTKITGYLRKEVVGQNPRILKSGEHPIEYYQKLWETITAGGTWRGEICNRKKNGELYWEYATISAITNKEGGISNFLAINEDITERKRVLAELQRYRHHLQEVVKERTIELTKANEKLQQEATERMRLVETLRESRERLRLQYNGIPIPMYTWQRVSNDFVLIDYNDAASTTIQGRIIDYMGRKSSEMFKGSPHILHDFESCFTKKTTVRRKAPYQLLTTKETKYFVTSYIFVPPNLVLVHMDDITERQQAEEKLKEIQDHLEELIAARTSELESINKELQHQFNKWNQSDQSLLDSNEQQLKLALDSTIVGTWDWNVETGEMDVSSQWAAMLGYSGEEVKEHVRSWAGLMHLDDIARVIDKLNSHFAGETPVYEAEHRLRTKTGEWKWILGRGTVVERDENGRVLRVTGIHRDITQRKFLEEELRKYKEWFESLIKTSNDWVWEMDKSMLYTYLSPQVYDMLGYEPAEILNQKNSHFMSPEEAARVTSLFMERFVSRKPLVAIKWFCLHKDGHAVTLQTNGLPYYDADGIFCGYRGTHREMP